LTFLEDLAVVMIVAGAVTIIFHRLGQPVVLGYMIAGIIIGPHTPPFPLITDPEAIDTLAGLGIIFLMFSLGLEFNLRKLRRVGPTALVAAVLEIVVMAWAGYEIGLLFGWKEIDSIFLGAMISISSTTIIVKALEELGRTKAEASQLVFGILIVEDILGIAMIALLTGFATTGSVDAGEALLAMGRLGLFAAFVLGLGLLTVPRLLSYVAAFRRSEVLLIVVLAIGFGVSLLSAKLGYSVALGAFLVGAIMAESREIGRVQEITEPIRDMFSAVFFVAIGLLIDPRLIVDYAIPIAVISAVILVGKILTCSTGTFLTGHDPRTSLRVGMSLAQIGEFSFIIAALGGSLQVTSGFLYPTAVCVSAITTFLTPYLIRYSDPLAEALYRGAPKPLLAWMELYARRLRRQGPAHREPVGRRLARRLAWRLLLEAALLAGVFITARVARSRRPGWLEALPERFGEGSTVFWGVALLVSLPILAVAFRDLRVLGTLLGGMGVDPSEPSEQTRRVRNIVSSTILIAGSAGLALLVVVLSSALLPPWHVLLMLVLALSGITALLWRPALKLYERAGQALQDTFSQGRTETAGAAVPLASVLGEAGLERMPLGPSAPAIGRRIRELEIRSRTGASVVAIERGGARIVNPSPDEELRAGDVILLLGDAAQRQTAREMLAEPPARNGGPPTSPGR
jgi:CPA2 family monovalent cation:H+ antiporter-2